MRVVSDDEAATGEYSSGYQALTAAGITVITDTHTSKVQHNKFLIIHDRDLARACYDEWQRLWSALDQEVYLPLVMSSGSSAGPHPEEVFKWQGVLYRPI